MYVRYALACRGLSQHERWLVDKAEDLKENDRSCQ